MTCPPVQKAFFTNMLPLIRPMANRLDVNEDFVLALSAFENSWGNDEHNKVLHNLIGLTHAGKNNLAFASDEACVSYFETHYGRKIRGIKRLEDFISALKKIGYNSVNPNYYGTFKKVYASVIKYKSACGATV